MKYQDYYAILGVERDASADDIKKAYRKLARKYHPDVSTDPAGEEKFKEVSTAYETLKDPEKRAAYDQLGRHASGQEFRPPPDWEKQFGGAGFGGGGNFAFDDIDLADLFAGLRGAAGSAGFRRSNGPMPGQDYEITAHISLDEAYRGTTVELRLEVPEQNANGQIRRVPRTFRANIPKGATDGQKLRLAGKGGKGINGGRDGDLYLNIALHPHPFFRVDGHDLYFDLPLTPWEAALGLTLEVPTLGGPVNLKIPPGTAAGRSLRLSKRGLPRPHGDPGDLLAVVQVVVPTVLSDHEKALFKQLAESSTFNPRGHFEQEIENAGRNH
ncbi:MAG: DnaJ C-terminal domain-containing protein [Betaproteobacteria bacterium]